MERSDSRARILGRVRELQVPGAPLPDVAGPWTVPPDRLARFRSMVELAGGSVEEVPRNALESSVDRIASSLDAVRVLSTVSGVASRGFVELPRGPHGPAPCDLAVVAGEFGVAENGAIWMTDRGVRERSLWFLCQHLAVVLDRERLVAHMHEAYERASLEGAAFGLFLSGPSKTADIEQAMVIGAHGPRSLRVLLVQSLND